MNSQMPWNANQEVTEEVVNEVVKVITSNNKNFSQQYVMHSLIDGLAVAILQIYKGNNTIERSLARANPKYKTKIKDLTERVLKKL